MLRGAILLLSLTGLQAYKSSEEDDCGIYPSCGQYGVGQWQILEDCHKYIDCSFENGVLVQRNLECPDDLVFTNEYNECVTWDRATQCKVFQETPCLISCPRVKLESTGAAATYQARRIGCFRISGTLFGGTMVHYQNMNGQYLAPDSSSTPLVIHWLVSESYGAFNGGIRNRKYDYIRCPFTGWNQGWQVDMGSGSWTEDPTMVLNCYVGDESASTTTAHPASSTTASETTTTASTTSTTTSGQPGSCHKDGCNVMVNCGKEFSCCQWDSASSSWTEKTCHCKNDFVYSEMLDMCTWADNCLRRGNGTLAVPGRTRADHECDDGSICEACA